MRKHLTSLGFIGFFISLFFVSSCSENIGGKASVETDADTNTNIDIDIETDPNTFTNPEAATDCNCTEPNVFCSDSCALEDVQTAADNAMASDISDTTVCVPACDPNPYAWPAGNNLKLTTNADKVIRLMGDGISQTKIVNFQVGVPGNSKLNLVELAHMAFDGNDTVESIMSNRLWPETLNTELYWHDFVIENYAGNYTLSLEGWLGVISNIEMWCEDSGTSQNPYGIGIHGDGVYSDHSIDFGTRNALFIEDSLFDSCP